MRGTMRGMDECSTYALCKAILCLDFTSLNDNTLMSHYVLTHHQGFIKLFDAHVQYQVFYAFMCCHPLAL